MMFFLTAYLILPALTAIGALHIHDQHVHVLALAHPNTLHDNSRQLLTHQSFGSSHTIIDGTFGGLSAVRLGHDGKLGAKQLVQQRACHTNQSMG